MFELPLILLSLSLAPQAAPAAAPACPAANEFPVYLETAVAPARPGGEIALSARTGQWGAETLPLSCLDHWTFSDPAVRLSDDGGHLVLDAAAQPGQTVEVSARFGLRTARTRLRIAPADGAVLTGLWRQVSVACASTARPTEPVRELRINDDDTYSVTFLPFESRADYWGKVAYDPADSRVSFTIERGNTVPEGVRLIGAATVEEARLTFDAMHFGQPTGPAIGGECRYVFERYGV